MKCNVLECDEDLIYKDGLWKCPIHDCEVSL